MILNYPSYDKNIGGWICSGCGVVTPVNYDDVGPTYRVAPLCKGCRNDWNKSCESIPRIYSGKDTRIEKTLTADDNVLRLLNNYRDENLLTALEMDGDCQKLADTFIKNNIYENSIDVSYSKSTETLNIYFQGHKWTWQNILVSFIKFPKSYNEITEIFDREIVRSLLDSDDWRRIGINKNRDGVCIVMRSQKLANSGIES